MTFFIASEKMLNKKSLVKKLKHRLKRQFSSISDDKMCVSDNESDIGDLKYFVQTLFKNVTFVTD